MKFWKFISEDYIGGIGTGVGQIEITAEEYTNIKSVIDNRPTPPDGCTYRLKADTLEWELYELPPVPPEPEEEATAEDYQSALGRFGV